MNAVLAVLISQKMVFSITYAILFAGHKISRHEPQIVLLKLEVQLNDLFEQFVYGLSIVAVKQFV